MGTDRLGASDVVEILRRSRYGKLPPSSFAAVAGVGVRVRLPRRSRPIAQGEPVRDVLVLGSGRVIHERALGSRSLVVGYGGPGDVVAEDAVAGGGASESVIVCEEVEAIAIAVSALQRLLSLSWELSSLLLAASHDALREVEDRRSSLLFEPVEARLLTFLKEAARRWGGASRAGTLIAAPFTHAEIARTIGSTRETVTLLLGKLKREGAVAFEGRRIVLTPVAP